MKQKRNIRKYKEIKKEINKKNKENKKKIQKNVV